MKSALTFCAVVILVLFVAVVGHRKLVPAYYRVKYYTAASTSGSKTTAAERVVSSNPFYAHRYVILVNMRQGKSQKRMSVYDLQTKKIVYQTRVMHGKGSGKEVPTRFSNAMNSNCTALGKYVVTGSYVGKYGYSFRLMGLDPTNSNTMARSVVLHSSNYVSDSRISYSLGCPAVSKSALNDLKAFVQPGTLLWIYNN